MCSFSIFTEYLRWEARREEEAWWWQLIGGEVPRMKSRGEK
jgi:hypothetical protein